MSISKIIESMGSTETMFETLSLDEMLQVMLHYHFKEEYILEFIHRSPFRRTAPHLFRTISFAGGHSVCANPDTRRIEIGIDAEIDTCPSLVAACGEGQVFNLLEMDFYPRDRFRYFLLEGFISKLEDLFVTGSSLELSYSNVNVTNHDSVTAISQLLRVLGRRFEGLTIAGASKYRCEITRNVMYNIRHNWSRLKRFKYYGCDPGALSSIWENVGGTLEEVEVCLIDTDSQTDVGHDFKWYDWGDLVAKVGQHCRKLTSIILDNPLYHHHHNSYRRLSEEEQYVGLLTSYGSQLVGARLDNVGSEYNLRRVADACKNLRVDMHENMHRFARVGILGNRLRNLTLRLQRLHAHNYNSGDTNVAPYMKCATALERLDIYADEKEAFGIRARDIFAAQMGGLEHLMLDMELSTDDLRTIARKTGNLRHLDLRRMENMSAHNEKNWECMRKILEANARLEYMAMREVMYRQGEDNYTNKSAETLEMVAQIVAVIKGRPICPGIKIEFASRKMPAAGDMRDACVPLKLRPAVSCFSFRDGKLYF